MLFSSFIAGVFFGSIMYLLEKGEYTGKGEGENYDRFICQCIFTC